MAAPRFLGGKDSRRMACERGCRAPPPAPWTTRARSMMARVGAAPQAKLEAVKMATQDMRKRLRPKRKENQLLAGGEEGGGGGGRGRGRGGWVGGGRGGRGRRGGAAH